MYGACRVGSSTRLSIAACRIICHHQLAHRAFLVVQIELE